MNILNFLKQVIDSCVTLMRNVHIWGGLTWWDFTISLLAVSIGIFLFKFFFMGRGGSK